MYSHAKHGNKSKIMIRQAHHERICLLYRIMTTRRHPELVSGSKNIKRDAETSSA